jgi:hypothetical protein
LTVKEWSRKLGIPEFTIYGRLTKKMPLERVFFQRKMQRGNPRYLTLDGLTLTLHGWAERLGISFNTISERVKRGWPIEKVLSIDRLTKDWSGHPSYKVLRRTGEKYNGSYLWEVECPYCGNVFKVVPGTLGKAVQSCGCLRYHDYTGETVGFLHVVKIVGTLYFRSDNPRYLYQCVCTYKGCGRTVLVNAHQLANGKQSCGCKMLEDCKTRHIQMYKEAFGGQEHHNTDHGSE